MECHTTVWIARAQSCKVVFCFCTVFLYKTVLLAVQKKVICTYPCLKEFKKISIMQSLNCVGYHFSKTGKMQNVDNLWSFQSRRDRSVVSSRWRLKLLLYTILILWRHSRSWSMVSLSCLSAQVAKSYITVTMPWCSFQLSLTIFLACSRCTFWWFLMQRKLVCPSEPMGHEEGIKDLKIRLTSATASRSEITVRIISGCRRCEVSRRSGHVCNVTEAILPLRLNREWSL